MEVTYIPLKKIVSLVIDYRGKTPLKLGGEWSLEGYRALSALNVKTRGLVAEDKIRYVNQDLYNKWMKEEVHRGDILITSEAPFGQVLQWNSEEKIVLSQRLFALRIKSDYCASYIYQYMASDFFYGELKARATGSTVEGLRQPALMKCKVAVPSLPIQCRIASILSIYDDLIEKNNRKITILQEMAEVLYKEWFVRFHFPGYKTAKFKDGIPEGWEYRPFGEIVTYERGVSYSSEEIDCEEGVDLINLKNINAYGGFRLDGTKKYNGKYKNNQVVQCGDLVMGVTDMTQDRRTVGAVALIPPFANTCVISADLIKLVSHIDNIFIYCLCKYGYYSKFFSQFANGSNVLHLKPSSLQNQKVLISTTELIDKFVKIVKPINDTINNLNRQNDILTRQRNLLLPRLMSGKLEVKA